MKREFTFFVLLALIAVSCNSKSERVYLTCPDNQHPHLIDLGLPSGTKWACCNVDDDHSKQSPTNFGSYYAWGETKGKDYYDWSTYIHCDGLNYTCHDLGSDIAGTQYDVAHVQWGGSWVMPSEEQLLELRDNCTIEWTKENGVYGERFTGQNGGTIFIPAAGNWNPELNYVNNGGCYRSSTLGESFVHHPDNARCLIFGRNGEHWYDCSNRCYGRSVRPVANSGDF